MSENQIQQGKRIEKPWGYELLWAETKEYVGKLLFVRKDESLSLQYHRQKEETIYIESGELWLEFGTTEETLEHITLTAGDTFHIVPGLIHRFNAKTDCRIFEVSTPHLTDVVRLKDRYGRS